MIETKGFRRTFLLVIAIVVVLTGSCVVQGHIIQASDYVQGLMDSRRDGAADGSFLSFIYGYFFGLFYIGYVAVTEPNVPIERVMLLEGKSRV